MISYDSLTVEFYSPPARPGGGKPFVTTPENSLVRRVPADGDDVFSARPADAYAFRIVPVLVHTTNQGIADESVMKIAYTSLPLFFLGGKAVHAHDVEKHADMDVDSAAALKAIASDFILTQNDVLVPFDPDNDVVLHEIDGTWEPATPHP